MTHKPAVGIGGFGRDNSSELINRSPFIASAAPSSSPTSKAPPPKPASISRDTRWLGTNRPPRHPGHRASRSAA
jgi:hypothetical protein